MPNGRLIRFLVISALLAALLTLTSMAFAASNTTTYHGTISVPNTVDNYTINLTAGNRVTATEVCDEIAPGNRPLDPYLVVFDPDDQFVTVGDDGFNAGNGGVNCNIFASALVVFVAAKTGTYTFAAQGYPFGENTTGPYTLRITVDFSTTAFTDGRINPQPAATTVLYCDGTTVHGLSVDGQVLFSVANGDSASGAGWTLAPTADGRMLFTGSFPDGKAYYFVYDGCPHGHFDALSGTPPTLFDSGGY